MIESEHAIYHNLPEALVAADYGVIYAYVSPSLHDGWLPEARLSALKWYEKIVLINSTESRGFILETGGNEPFDLIAVGHGFALFRARNAQEFHEARQRITPFIEALNIEFIREGKVDPHSYHFPR